MTASGVLLPPDVSGTSLRPEEQDGRLWTNIRASLIYLEYPDARFRTAFSDGLSLTRRRFALAPR